MDDYDKVFADFEKCSLTLFERDLISELYPAIKQIIENFTETRRAYGNWPRYDRIDTGTKTTLKYNEKIDRIVKVLDSSYQEREKFSSDFPVWRSERRQNIEKLRKIAESSKDIRTVSKIVKITAGSVGVAGGAAIIGSLVFPPAAPILLPTWLGGAAAPAVSSLAVAGGVAAAGGAAGSVGAIITEEKLTDKTLDEVKEVIEKDKKLLKQLGVFEFLDELNNAIDDLFGKSTSSKILNNLIDFLAKVPPILDDIQQIQNALHTWLEFILPEITQFLHNGILLASVVLSIFFVVFLNRRRGCAILKHLLALGLVSAVDASKEILRLIAAADRKHCKPEVLIVRQVFGEIMRKVYHLEAEDIADIVMSPIDLGEGSKMIFEVANQLEKDLIKYQRVNVELQKCVARRLNVNCVTGWTAVVVNHVPLSARHEDVKNGVNQYLPGEVWDCIILERLPTNGNHWLVKVKTGHAQLLLRQTYINIKEERCLVMK